MPMHLFDAHKMMIYSSQTRGYCSSIMDCITCIFCILNIIYIVFLTSAGCYIAIYD